MPTSSELLPKALSYLDKNQIDEAKKELLQAAEEQDAAVLLCLVHFYSKYEEDQIIAQSYSDRFYAVIKQARGDLKPHEKTLFEWMGKQAATSCVVAIYILAHMHLEGLGTFVNVNKAFKLYTMGANQNFALSQNALGVMYYYGQGVTQSDEEAIAWYRKAAEQGNVEAQRNLGTMYYNGYGGPQNYGEALPWLRKAAEQGDAVAQFELGMVYHMGTTYNKNQGIEKNLSKAFDLYYQSALQGSQNAVGSIQKFLSAKEHRPSNASASSDKIKLQLQEITQKLDYEFGLLIGLHNQAGKFIDSLFLLPEYSEYYSLLYNRVQKYIEVLTALNATKGVLVTAYALANDPIISPHFPDHKVIYQPKEQDLFCVRYYPELEAWAFGEKNVAIADKLSALFCEIEEEKKSLKTTSPQVKIVHRFEYYLAEQGKAAKAISEQEWPAEVDIKTAFKTTERAFKEQQEKRSTLSKTPAGVAECEQHKSYILWLTARFLGQLKIEKATPKQMQELWADFCEDVIDFEQECYRDYKSLEHLLNELIDSEIAEGNSKLRAKLAV